METRIALETAEGLAQLEELIRLTAPPAVPAEICTQGLALTAAALGARAGVMLLCARKGASPETAASWGNLPTGILVRAGETALLARDGFPAAAGAPGAALLVVEVPGEDGPAGALVFDLPAPASPLARRFAGAAAQALAAALLAARSIDASRLQGELLARRNVELQALREIAARLQEVAGEEEILQVALDLLLGKLGLEAGWIFWGEESRGRLELGAARGVSEEFVGRARQDGIGTCLCLDVFATGRLRLARNTTDCPRLPDLVGSHDPLTHACIPLKFDRGILGVLNIVNRPGHLFSPQELQFLETAGTQICLAVDKARTARAEARRNEEARALASLAGAIGGSLEQKTVLAAVGNDIRRLLEFDRCAIFLGGDAASLSLEYLSGPPMEGFEVGRAADLAAVGSRALPEAFRERRTIIIDDALADPRSNSELARRWGIGSAILVPLEAHGRVAGLLHASRERRAPFRPEEVELAVALAGHAAVAIENARLYREARESLLGLQEAQYGMMRAERLAAVGTLASSLAHEIRNPLNSINLMLVLLTRRLAGLEQAADLGLEPMVDNVRREIERLDNLVQEFLSLSTIDRLSRKEIDPVGVVREMLALMAPMAASQGITIREELSIPLPRLSLDRQKIKQVLINLVRNAIEAMPRGGTLTVAARCQDDGVAIEVTDTGIGIEPGLDVFDFFTSTKRGGTGLGLPIARRIVEGHEGRLTYDSVPGRGTTFRLTFPGGARPGDALAAGAP